MKHLVLCRTFAPMIGGIERYTSELFARAGLDVEIVAPNVPGAMGFDAQAPYRVSRYFYDARWARGKIPLLPLTLNALPRALRVRPAVLFSDQVQTGGVGLPISRLTGERHVVFAYGMELTPKRLYRFKRTVFRRSDAVIAISEFTRNALIAVYGVHPDKVWLVRPGVDTSRFTPPQRNGGHRHRLGLASDDQVVLTVGRLESSHNYKGYDRVIRLLARLLPEFPGLLLVVAGDGTDRPRLEGLAGALGVTGRVKFAGRVTDNDLASLYQCADLFVLPSGAPDSDPFKAEGYGIVYAEASASGVPCVAYRLGGTNDVIEDGVTGVLTNPDETSLFSAVRKLLSDSDGRIQMGRAARVRATRELGWDSAVASLHALVRHLTDIKQPLGELRPQ